MSATLLNVTRLAARVNAEIITSEALIEQRTSTKMETTPENRSQKAEEAKIYAEASAMHIKAGLDCQKELFQTLLAV